ncbi:MAG: Rrf2 family transcriptional regulator [Clostridia bacterium]|nr:Rrf2 family transcriptional regulator [Clostridia bacterium]
MISTKGRYAIRLLLDMAEQPSGTPVTLDSIAERQDISKKYLESVVRLLVTAKMVKGSSGKGGGYQLLRKPEEYTIGEILRKTEISLAPVACLMDNADVCPREKNCKTLPMWINFNKMVNDFFDDITIADLISGDKF